MSDDFFPVPAEWASSALFDRDGRAADYRRSIDAADAYWLEQAKRLDWVNFPTKTNESSFHEADFGVKWFADGVLNVSVNCIDRHLAERGDQTAIIWEPDSPDAQPRRYTYAEVHEEVCRFANVLKAAGAKKGERITVYMPMIPEAAFALLACARIGAIHSVVFGGFSPEALAGRIIDCDSTLVITADEGCRAGRQVPLKTNVDAALKLCTSVRKVIVVQATGGAVAMEEGRDLWLHEEAAKVSADCAPEPMNAEDPLFILYTSGSTGKPKGVLHTTGGYLLWASLTHELCFDYRPGDIYWCAADIGWVTGHSYIVYGPLANGATTLIYEGVPNYPTPSRIWEVVDRHQVQTIFTAPTALRALMKEGDEFVHSTSRQSLRLLGTVGEPINPEAWRWYHHVVGEDRCPIIDTWWQTETGGAMIAPMPGATDLKPGSATLPMPGVVPQIVDAEGHVLDGAAEGNLVIAQSWPGQMRTVWGDHERFFQTYFTTFPGKYTTGDGARRDEDGYYWITGRVDDVINVSGHRMGTAEVESALVLHEAVAEAAVVGFPHDIKGQGIYAYVTLNSGEEATDELRQTLVKWVRSEIGPIATPDVIQFAPGLPKTRSGKIMRRILRKIAEGEVSAQALGDISTLADPSVVDNLVANRQG
ncbi:MULTISPECIES: acetate--CoA ligase [Sphingobium]|uniref:Acetyl-coenzyme A synthetase n=1 Tax=Sphingobium fuliginis (strain ATCC 27551) TaxID=336203 RepID=A0ABQ1EKS3_SPHSA|nr:MULTISPECIES: acetate--CoA ligase [Sphingobium]AJR22931.1 acetyl-CoA synthetase [Sphingobium sp. YBL2]RYM01306.1 acetate--CoA ligase [Sphingobium fuliginis]WDA34359.1 acetate--CoA ligase [Sphingobium sp. YC-XJ3]GFZ76414.1 acetyl-coenzyme A synthetase [Sphingobium fuliginis]